MQLTLYLISKAPWASHNVSLHPWYEAVIEQSALILAIFSGVGANLGPASLPYLPSAKSCLHATRLRLNNYRLPCKLPAATEADP